MANWPLTSVQLQAKQRVFYSRATIQNNLHGKSHGFLFLTLTAIVTGTNSRMEVKGFGRIRDAYSFARSKCFLKEMYIPDELLKHDLDGKPSVDIPSCPVLVFVDIKDEKLGGRLYNEFCYRLNKKQIVGGDDVVNWILGVICDLKLPESPSIVPDITWD